MTTPPASAPDALQQILDETRQRFIAAFAAQCESIRILVDEVALPGAETPIAELSLMTHRLSGLAGTIGFPTVSARAAELEELLAVAGSGAFDALLARDVIGAIQEAFIQDLANTPAYTPQRAPATPAATPALAEAKILVAEDEADQRAIVTACLEGAGYMPIAVASGDLVVEMARAERPALILLDIAMPGLDGFSACRRLKADPELARIPVIFMTTGANLNDKLTGLALGAEEFLSKPVDMRELVLRIQLLLERYPTPDARVTTDTRSVIDIEQPGRPSPVAAVSTIVLAEDDPDVTRIVDAQARAAGYETIIAFDGEQALAAVLAHAPDVLVLDLMMPMLSGFDVLGLLRDSPPPRPKIIVLSGRGREEDVVRAFELGADDYMTKPFNPQELMARIARLLKPLTDQENKTG